MNKKLFLATALGALAMSCLKAQVIYTPNATTVLQTTNNTGATAGFVGIGTTTPTQKLEVSGNIKSTGTLYANELKVGWGTQGGGANTYITPSFIRYSGTFGGGFKLGTTSHVGTITGFSTGTTLLASGVATGIGGAGDETDLGIFAGAGKKLVLGGNRTAHLTILNNGYLGVGTATPSYILDAVGDKHRIGNFSWYGDGGGSSMLFNANPDYKNNGDWGNDTKYAGYFTKMGVNHATGDFTITSSNTSANAGQFILNTAMKTIFKVDKSGNLFLGTGGMAITCTSDRFAIGKFANNDGTGAFTPAFSLRNNGTLAVKELCTNPGIVWCDYVFAKDYKLRPLAEVESYIQSNQHLPEIPASADVAKEGLRVSEMLTLQMKKIEELTLYIIAQEKRIQSLENQLEKK